MQTKFIFKIIFLLKYIITIRYIRSDFNTTYPSIINNYLSTNFKTYDLKIIFQKKKIKKLILYQENSKSDLSTGQLYTQYIICKIETSMENLVRK